MADVKGRSSRRALGRILAASAAAFLLVGVWAVSSAGATQFTTGAAQSKVDQTQSQITQIEQTIAQEQRQSAVLGTEYDSETVHLQAVRAAIAATDARLAQVRETIVVDKGVLAKAAVQEYVLGAQGTQITSLFSTSANTLVISEEYSDTAVGNLNGARHALEAAEVKLDATRAQQQVQEQHAQTAAARVQILQQENQQAATRSEATLQSLTGTLGKEVATAEQAKAEKEAAAAQAAEERAAQAEKERAAAQAAEERAAQAEKERAAQAEEERAAAAAQQAAQTVNELGGTTVAASQAANQASSSAGGPTVGFSGAVSDAGQAAVQAAESQLGVPYVWGGETPGVGFDCSGLTQWSWSQAGVAIPRTAEEQDATVPHVSLTDLQPGDLLFYYDLDGTGTVDHVVMYVGSGPYGSQTVIQAPYTGSTVSYDSLYTYGLVAAGQP